MLGWAALLWGCTDDMLTTMPEALSPAFDPTGPAIVCATGSDAPLLDAVLADAGLTADAVGYDAEAWQAASYAPFLDDRFLLPWFRDVHWAPLALQCHTGQAAADLDHALTTSHPVATALGTAMAYLDVVPTLPPTSFTEQDVAKLGKLPADVEAALAPILMAMKAVATVRDELAKDAPDGARRLVQIGHGGVLIDVDSAPDLTDDAVQRWVKRPTGPRLLYDPARVLAFAIEDADLGRFAGRTDARGTFRSALGDVVIAGPGPDAPGDLGEVALYLDLGGDDVYVHPAGASSARVPVAVHIDVGGDDVYGYAPAAEPPLAGLLPEDEWGRYPGDAVYGPISLSRTGRQGSGRFGVGLLFDLGGNDAYASLRMGQGYGHLGVGVLFDAEGDDTYEAEAASQGAAVMGIGLLIDREGRDTYRTFANSQGFAGPLGVGLAVDGGGDDTWFADPGRQADGGIPLYATAQLPGDANASLSQGASTGIRNDTAGVYLSGGLGVLRDRSGDDTYVGSLFAQGSGYWQGAGYLLDGGGADAYDALWYVQGGAAHYAIGALMDDGPEGDALNQVLAPINVHLGSGHDFSVGLYVNEGGDDVVRLAGLAGGASNCQGVGIAIDNAGLDVWDAHNVRSLGLGNQSTECNDASRTRAPSIGLFVDSGGGSDVYRFPDDPDREPGNDRAFGHREHDAPDEFGGAVDGDGATSLHASGVRP